MQLIYLYIEKYKNIKKQGFNFSPEFECYFDGESLTVEKKDSGKSIFPEGINIMAIVGKNGSGKSTISEVIATFSFQEFLDNKTFLLFFDGKSFSIKQSYTGAKINFKVNNLTHYKFNKANKSRTIDIVYFSNDVATIFNNPKLNNIKTYNNIDGYVSHQKNNMPNNKYSFHKEKIEKLETFNERFKKLLNENKNLFKNISEKIKFDVYQNELHFYEMGVYFVNEKPFLDLLNIDKLSGTTIFNLNDFVEKMDEKTHLFKLLILFRLVQYEQSTKKDINSICDEIKSDFQKEILTIEDWENINKIINDLDSLSDVYTPENLQDLEKRFYRTDGEIWRENKTYTLNENIDNSNELINLLLLNYNRVDFLNSLDKDYNFYSLSSGEREYISIFTAYCHHLKRIAKNKSHADNEFIFYFDEVDLGLHPNWQKSIIKDLVYFAEKYIKKDIQLILTSHSPFILSDIPKQNIIFLKDGKNVNDEVDIDTFGANIHTLLSHGFFMEDGLMGEYAKSKINEVIKLLNKPGKLGDDEIGKCESIIAIIGEPILKRQLQKMLVSKRLDYLSNDIKDEIAFLKHRIGILSKRK